MAKKILIVEDEVNLVEMLKFRLERNGYQVSAAYDGENGLKIARQFLPDLILLDINLAFVVDPKEDRGSAEIVKALKSERYPSIRIDSLEQFKQLTPGS